MKNTISSKKITCYFFTNHPIITILHHCCAVMKSYLSNSIRYSILAILR